MHLKDWLDFALKALAGSVGLIGALIAIFKYLAERKLENETARLESRKPFTTKQQEIYFDLVTTTGTISNRFEEPEWLPALKHFWVLFWGPLPMVADEEVAKASDKFADTLVAAQDQQAMRNASMELARACRRSLGDSWDLQLNTFDKSYHSGTL